MKYKILAIIGLITLGFIFYPENTEAATIFDNSLGTGTTISTNPGQNQISFYNGIEGDFPPVASSTLPTQVILPSQGYIRVKFGAGSYPPTQATLYTTGRSYNLFNQGTPTGTIEWTDIGDGIYERQYDLTTNVSPAFVPNQYFAGILIARNNTVSNNLILEGGIGSVGYWQTTPQDETFSYAYQICDSGGCDDDFGGSPVVNTNTRFISVTPEYATTTATTTTIGAHVYINEEDYDDDMYLSMSFTNQTLSMTGGSALDAWNSATGQGLEIRIPLVAGDNDVSTTTTFLMGGQTHGAYSVRNPNFINQFSWVSTFWQPSVLISTTTDFVVGYKTGLDIAVEQGGASVAQYLLTGTTTGANTILNCSNLLSGGLTPCLTSIFVPNAQVLSADMQRFRDGFLSVWPLGYVTRFVEITLTTATSSLPTISYTTASSSMFGVIDIDLDPFGSLASADSPMNYTSDSLEGKTIWEIMEQPITIVVYLMLLFMILHDLTGVAKHNSHRKT